MHKTHTFMYGTHAHIFAVYGLENIFHLQINFGICCLRKMLKWKFKSTFNLNDVWYV